MNHFNKPNWHESPEGEILPPVSEPEVSFQQLHINDALVRADHAEFGPQSVATPDHEQEKSQAMSRHPSAHTIPMRKQRPSVAVTRGESEGEVARTDTVPFRENIPTPEAQKTGRAALRLIRGSEDR